MNTILPRTAHPARLPAFSEMRLPEIGSLDRALSALTICVVITDENGRILYANDAGEAVLVAGTPLQSSNGLLATRSASATMALRGAVGQAAGEEAGCEGTGIDIPVPHGDGSAVIHVAALERRQEGMPDGSPSAAIFLAGTAHITRLPADALASVFGLTPAETRILVRIVEGDTPSQIARSTQVAKNTVRTHLLRLFAKTGTRRQAELIKLARQFALPLRPGAGVEGAAP